MSRIVSERDAGRAQSGSTGPGLLALAFLGAAVGLIAAIVCVGAMWMAGWDINGGLVGAVAGSIAGATTALLGSFDHIE